MNQHLDSLYEKLKASPHWRDDFKIEKEEKHGEINVYYISAKDQEPATIAAIAALNEILKK